jgi:hypothetical protein
LQPSSFLALGATANALKGLCWMTAGSTRAAFNVSFARRENISDITAKATSQTIATSLIGTVIGCVYFFILLDHMTEYFTNLMF